MNDVKNQIVLPFKPLTPEAFEASQVHVHANFGRPPLAMMIIVERANFLGHSLTEEEYRELVQMDEIPEQHQRCCYPGCPHQVSPFRTALVLDGEIKEDRKTGERIWRGGFLVVKGADGYLQVRGYCPNHLKAAREDAEAVTGFRPEPQSLEGAKARLEAIIESFREKRRFAAQEQDAAREMNRRSLCQVSAPRNSPANIGGRR